MGSCKKLILILIGQREILYSRSQVPGQYKLEAKEIMSYFSSIEFKALVNINRRVIVIELKRVNVQFAEFIQPKNTVLDLRMSHSLQIQKQRRERKLSSRMASSRKFGNKCLLKLLCN